MITDAATGDQLSRVISRATAPAFLLGAVAAFISVLITRLNRITDRSKSQSRTTIPRKRFCLVSKGEQN